MTSRTDPISEKISPQPKLLKSQRVLQTGATSVSSLQIARPIAAPPLGPWRMQHVLFRTFFYNARYRRALWQHMIDSIHPGTPLWPVMEHTLKNQTRPKLYQYIHS